jgi:hypothetical protein
MSECFDIRVEIGIVVCIIIDWWFIFHSLASLNLLERKKWKWEKAKKKWKWEKADYPYFKFQNLYL